MIINRKIPHKYGNPKLFRLWRIEFNPEDFKDVSDSEEKTDKLQVEDEFFYLVPFADMICHFQW